MIEKLAVDSFALVCLFNKEPGLTKPEGVRKLTAYTVLRDHVIKPLIAGASRPRLRPPKIVHPIDQRYQNLREELYKTFGTLGLAVA